MSDDLKFVPDDQQALKFVPDQAPARTTYDPSSGGGTLSIGPWDTGIKTPQAVDRFLAGAGKATVDIGRGVGQDVGLVSRKDIEESRQRDAPLMATAAGKFGNVVGTAADIVPTLAIPGVNTVAGAAALGTGLGLAQPSTSTRETLLNTGLGMLAGGAGQALGNVAAQGAQKLMAARQAAAAARASANTERDMIWSAARKEGYVAPPTALNPSAANTALESISGKAATRQVAMAKNAEVTNKLVRRDLGLMPDSSITKSALRGVRKRAGQSYKDVEDALGPSFKNDGYYRQDLSKIMGDVSDLEATYPGISKQADPQVKELVASLDVPMQSGKDAIALSKFLRAESRRNYQAAWGAGGNPTKLSIARAQSQAAEAIEDQIRRTLKDGGQEMLADAWDTARTTIAKAHQAEAALKGGNINAVKLAQQMRANKPVSGGMGLAAKFADHFEDVAKLPKSGAGVSKLAATIAGAGTLGGAALHSVPTMGASLALAASPYATRAAMLSRLGQRALARPVYRPNLTGTALLQGARGLGRGIDVTKGGQPLLPSIDAGSQ